MRLLRLKIRIGSQWVVAKDAGRLTCRRLSVSDSQDAQRQSILREQCKTRGLVSDTATSGRSSMVYLTWRWYSM